MDGQRNPEIQRVLAALNSFSQQQHQHVPQNLTHPYHPYSNQGLLGSNPATTVASTIPGLGFPVAPATYDRPITPPRIHRHQSSTPTQLHHKRTIVMSQPQPEALRSKTSTPKYDVPDASSITTWPAALKHVTRHLVPNEKVTNRVKHLINEQHKHEREWWAGREAIVARHQGRTGTSQQVSAILQSLGAEKASPLVSTSLRFSPEQTNTEQEKADEAELKAYDEKVYKALCAMVADFDRQLREMGVPFYAIRHELVVVKDGPEKIPGEHKGKIDKGELRELQKRMCQTLEDLLGDAD